MASLPEELFTIVEKAVLEARACAEHSAQAAITTLAVNRPEPFSSLSSAQRRLRNALRARARQLGDGNFHRGLPWLVEEIAYQHWHQMLFARFLAENGLLMHPTGVPVTLQDCAELAREEGDPDEWSTAARYASKMLPGIFRTDDPVMQVRFAPEGRLKVERILSDLPAVVFTADDALGWMYQFWQSKKKDEVNASERKIGGTDIAPVTQLFTEDYMVRFLLENSLGAWWAARHPESPLVKTFTYLRFREDGTPAAGTFPGWPDRAAKITMMDPCGGSGHFLAAGLEMLTRMRMEEEGLGEAAAADAVLRDNLFGLEIDPRCTQIAAFTLALAAWKMGGYRELPVPNVACSGIPVEGQLRTWTKLAGDDANLRATLERLYHLFRNAPDLGSLINPADVPPEEQMFAPDFDQVEPLLENALAKEHDSEDPVGEVFGAAAQGVLKAGRLLTRQYTLVATNVPYLSRGSQARTVADFCETNYRRAKADLATVFVERCEAYCVPDGTVALVTPQNWFYQPVYEEFRRFQLGSLKWNMVGRLGPRAFRTISGEIVNVALLLMTCSAPHRPHTVDTIDAYRLATPAEKAKSLRASPLTKMEQLAQLRNPDARITLGEIEEGAMLSKYASTYQGIKTGDDPRYKRCFWEIRDITDRWRFYQSSVERSVPFGGLEHIIDWLHDGYDLARHQGVQAWGKLGVAVSQTGKIACSLYYGDIFDSNISPIILDDAANLCALWSYCLSSDFPESVRQIDQSLKVTNSSVVKVPFDLEHWQEVADAAGPLPKPYSNDPTQWLFNGHPVGSTESLQVAVARLLGYHWPQQKPDDLDVYAVDGILCLPPVAGEPPAAERLRALLAAAYGEDWSSTRQQELLAAVGLSGKDLDEWLQDGLFVQHCKLFHNCPFIWHIWDGRRDGFSALVNYHKLDAAQLDKLIYTYLGAWIRAQRRRRDAGESGAEGRLVAALELQEKLKAIQEGEPPYDIYVRWKPLHEQPIGWNPDLNDGVRLNIRPFVIAGVLRRKFTIHWRKDRGKNPDGSQRINDLHITVVEKRAARKEHAKSGE